MADEHAISDPRFEQDRSDYAHPLPDDVLAEMFDTVAAATVDSHPAVLGRLRQLPTAVRIGLGIGCGTSFGMSVLLLHGLRGDLQDASVAMVAALVFVVCVSISAIIISLRGLHQRHLGRAVWLISMLSLLGPLVLAVVPGLWPGIPGGDVQPLLSGCFWLGCLVAIPTATVLSLLHRSTEPALWRILTVAGAGGCAGFITQQLFCPENNLLHLVGSHGSLGVTAGVWVVVLLWLRGLRSQG